MPSNLSEKSWVKIIFLFRFLQTETTQLHPLKYSYQAKFFSGALLRFNGLNKAVYLVLQLNLEMTSCTYLITAFHRIICNDWIIQNSNLLTRFFLGFETDILLWYTVIFLFTLFLTRLIPFITFNNKYFVKISHQANGFFPKTIFLWHTLRYFVSLKLKFSFYVTVSVAGKIEI